MPQIINHATVNQMPPHLLGNVAATRRLAATAAAPAYARPVQSNAPKTTGAFDPQVFLDTAGAGRWIVKYAAGAEIFRQGDHADAVFYVQSGKVQITVVSENGKEGVIATPEAKQFFGEGCLAGQTLHSATAAAATACVVVRLEKQAMIRALRDEPALSHLFISFLLSRNIRTEADLVDQLFNSSEKRLARVLLLLTTIGKDQGTQTVPYINQEILAQRVGTTRSRINFFMNKFRKLGFIEYSSGSLRIHAALQSVVTNE